MQQTAKTTLLSIPKQESKYKKDLDEIKAEADKTVEEGKLAHHKTSYFELAEGLLEISLILSSLYFLSHKKFFPMLGLLLGVSGGYYRGTRVIAAFLILKG